MTKRKKLMNDIHNLTEAYKMAYMIYDSRHIDNDEVDLNMEHALVAMLDYIDALKDLLNKKYGE